MRLVSTKFLAPLTILVLSVFIYLHYEEPTSVAVMVQPLVQDVGSSASLQVPLQQDSFVSSSTVRLDGITVVQTPYLWIDQGTSYFVSTYSGLPVGDYNIVVNLKYKLNPIKTVEQQFTLATLQVKNRGESNGHRSSDQSLCADIIKPSYNVAH